jgi:hypothetical protein
MSQSREGGVVVIDAMGWGRVIGCGGSGGARGLAGGRGSRAGGWGAGLLAYRRGAIAVDDARDPSDLLLHGEQFGGDEVGELLDLRGCLGRGAGGSAV